jgi:hypothetical protein
MERGLDEKGKRRWVGCAAYKMADKKSLNVGNGRLGKMEGTLIGQAKDRVTDFYRMIETGNGVSLIRPKIIVWFFGWLKTCIDFT